MAFDKTSDAATAQTPGAAEKSPTAQKNKTFGVAFFENQHAALAAMEQLQASVARFDQLNIVIKEEVKNLDPLLDKTAHVYCGPVWWQVHEHRFTEGFYKECTHGTFQSPSA